jgi:hypothetical protein
MYTKFWSQGKRSCGIPRRKWEDDIRMNLTEIGGEGVDGCIWFRMGTSGAGSC